jgi:hypothetical protein
MFLQSHYKSYSQRLHVRFVHNLIMIALKQMHINVTSDTLPSHQWVFSIAVSVPIPFCRFEQRYPTRIVVRDVTKKGAVIYHCYFLHPCIFSWLLRRFSLDFGAIFFLLQTALLPEKHRRAVLGVSDALVW